MGICTPHSIREETVTNAVLAEVRKICKQYSDNLDLEQLTDEANQKLFAQKKHRQKSKESVKANLSRLNAKIDKTYDDRLDDIISEDDFQRIYKKLKEEQSALQHKANALEKSDGVDLYDKSKVKELVGKFLNTEEISKELIVSLIERVELTQDKEVLIHFRFKELNLPKP